MYQQNIQLEDSPYRHTSRLSSTPLFNHYDYENGRPPAPPRHDTPPPPLPPKDGYFQTYSHNSVVYPEDEATGGILGSHLDPLESTKALYDPGYEPNSYRHDYGYGKRNGSFGYPKDYTNEHIEPLRPRRRRFKFNWKKAPWFVWTISVIQVGVFIAELARMGKLTGSPIQTKPTFNPMIGPSSYVMINMGARFTPCMHYIPNVTDATNLSFPCPNSTTVETDVCSLSELCGMGGLPPPPKVPDQWWRFIAPIFLHAGFIHIGFNLLLQLKLGADLEKEIGIVRFFIVYFASGIAGFVLGGNFTPDGIASMGASGSIFGVISLDLLDLLFNWQQYASPKRNLAIHIAEIVVSFVIGLLPGLDNFSHIGGFAMGILTGTAILRSPLKIRAGAHLQKDNSLFNGDSSNGKLPEFNWRNPLEHFHQRSRWWYAWVFVRVACVALAVVYFVVLIRQFENGGGHCSWCKYLSCLPVNGWCDQGNITTGSATSSSQ
jgi:membrane associated rhomboid family serine protease